MSTEHTPGPWYVTGDHIRSNYHERGPGALLFSAGPMFESYDPDPAEVQANLVLAAAATQLLAALERLLAHVGDACQATDHIHTDESCSICNARAAIAAATTETSTAKGA